MARPTACARCGADLSGEVDRGLCPFCLLNIGLDDAADDETLVASEHARSAGAATEPGLGHAAADARFTGPRRIAGYRVLRELGSGGMGTVFEAYDERMGRHVALKVLSLRLSGSPTAGKRFENEAWIAGRLSHPNLVKVHERGEHEGYAYYAMELVDGGSLDDVLQNLRRWGRDDARKLELGSKHYIDWAIGRIVQAARALDHAHRQGVVHRDVKPMNLLLTREGDAIRIADFGLAVDLDATRLTRTGDVLGTVIYMAPEQVRGDKDRIDARTDVYALGVTLFELLTLQPPYEGRTPELYANSVLTNPPRRARRLNRRVSRDLEIVIGKALEKNPRDRYASAAELADDLERVLRLQPIAARPPGAPQRLLKWARRKPVHAALWATLIVAVPLTAALGYRAVEHRRLVRAQEKEALEQRLRRLEWQGRYREEMETAGRLIELDPGYWRGWRARAIAATRVWSSAPERDPRLEARAVADIDRFVELEPESPGRHRIRGWVHEQLGREQEARAAYETAERLRGTEPTAEDLEMDALLAMQRGNYEDAIRISTELQAMLPGNVKAVETRALAYEELGEVDKAIDDYRFLSSRAPDNPWFRYQLGRLYTEEGELEIGAIHLEELLGMADPDAADYSAMASNALERAKLAEERTALTLFDEAEQAARRSLELDPDSTQGHFNLGAILMERNRIEGNSAARVDEAVRHYEEAARLDLENGDTVAANKTRIVICDARVQSGDIDAAVATCEEAARLCPDEANAFYNLAAAYALDGRVDDALAALERDFELGDFYHEYLENDPPFATIRDDAGFRDLIARMRTEAAEHE